MKKFLVSLVTTFIWFPGLVLMASQIDINSASLVQLDQLTGVGPVIAQRIIDARPYSSLDDLLRVSGIGPKTLQKIKDQGLASVAPASLPKSEKSVTTTENEAWAVISKSVKNEPSPRPAATNPWPLFWGTLGAIGLAGGIGIYIKFKHIK